MCTPGKYIFDAYRKLSHCLHNAKTVHDRVKMYSAKFFSDLFFNLVVFHSASLNILPGGMPLSPKHCHIVNEFVRKLDSSLVCLL